MISPVLSIIVPVYNVEAYIKRCLKSVASQTFQNYELLLIDDGSTDGSGDICKKFTEKNPQKVQYIYKKNDGQGPSRDLGVTLAKGKYITFLDADDWWAPEFCELMIDAMIKYDVDIAVCDINYIEENNNVQNHTVSQIRLPESQKIIPREFPDSINRMRTYLWGKIFHRSLYIKSGLKQAGHKYQDFPVTVALIALSQSVCRVPRPMYFYYRSRHNSTINHAAALKFMPDSIRDLAENFIKLNLFEYYYKYLEKMAFSQVRFAIKRLETLGFSGEEQDKISFHQPLFKVMNDYFPNWINPYGMNICVLGSDTLKKIVMSFLYKDADYEIDSKIKYDFIFSDSLNVVDIEMQSMYLKHNAGKRVIVGLPKTGREKISDGLYDEFKNKCPNTDTIFPDEMCDANGNIGESEIWNIADLIWYRFFSENKECA
jgi:glycosyltransferase involved in cell wall biosynthesis